MRRMYSRRCDFACRASKSHREAYFLCYKRKLNLLSHRLHYNETTSEAVLVLVLVMLASSGVNLIRTHTRRAPSRSFNWLPLGRTLCPRPSVHARKSYKRSHPVFVYMFMNTFIDASTLQSQRRVVRVPQTRRVAAEGERREGASDVRERRRR